MWVLYFAASGVPSDRVCACVCAVWLLLSPVWCDSGKDADKVEAWEDAVMKAQTAQEHAGLRLVNDDLMLKV